jgi:hypothetical protein
MKSSIVLTLDTDWAPDFVIDDVADLLTESRVRSTWFITHDSPALARLRQHPEWIELGIHPNFMPGSTHGDTPEAVLRHCVEMVPSAQSMRTHGLLQSAPLLDQVMLHTSIQADVSMLLQYAAHLQPFQYRMNGRSIWRIPFFWEDNFEMEQEEPEWHLIPLLSVGEGLKVFNFHPIHIYLNSKSAEPYSRLKDSAPNLMEATPAQVAPLINSMEEGTRTLFIEIVGRLAGADRSLFVSDLYPPGQPNASAR